MRLVLRFSLPLVSALATTSLLLHAAGAAGAQTVGRSSDPTNVMYSLEEGKNGKPGQLSRVPIPQSAFHTSPRDPAPKTDAGTPGDPGRVSSALEALLASGDPHQRVSVLVNLREDATIPRLPVLPPGERRDGAVARDLGRQQDQLVDALRSARRQSQAGLVALLEQQVDLDLRQQFWLVNAFLAEVPLGAVDDILLHDRVQYIQLEHGGERPPSDGIATNDVSDGRRLIVSDPYFILPNMTGGYIGLLDTGVRTTHTTFDPVGGDRIDYLRDCVSGGLDCNTAGAGFTTDDTCWNHGTATASIITGNANQGTDWRGVTGITLDTWRVYSCLGLNSAATVRGFENGLLAWDRVFVAEVQAVESESGTIATAADNAFDAGAVVISANGNYGPAASTVASPAIAHKSIGVGAYYVGSLATPSYQGRGPATDLRYKPDLQTPTDTETASTVSATAQQVFTGTSGATPYAAGMAALTQNFMLNSGLIEPGHVYARLIQSGQETWSYDNVEGAGDAKMPTCGNRAWGKTTINGTGGTVDIPIVVGAVPARTGIEAAVWWPESVGEAPDDIDLFLIDPAGIERARGYSGPSIWERVSYTSAPAQGTWTLRINGYFISSGPQTVYWSRSLRGC